MDRNQVTGILLIAVLAVVYFVYNQHEQKTFLEQKRVDSIAYATAHPRPRVDSIKPTIAVAPSGITTDSATDALRKTQPPSYYGQAQTVTLENKKLSLQFTSKGAYPVAASIKDYKTYGQKPLFLFNGPGNQLSAILPFDNGKSTADLY